MKVECTDELELGWPDWCIRFLKDQPYTSAAGESTYCNSQPEAPFCAS